MLVSSNDGGSMLRKWAQSAALLLCSAWILSACQGSMIRQFEEVKPGMEKNDVLALMGSPNQAQRFHGKDRWYYNFYDNNIRFQKEVHFFEGNAVYIGDTWQPPAEKSAVAQDALNAQRNRELDDQMAKDIETYRREYENYESKSKGEDKVHYVPTFEPVR